MHVVMFIEHLQFKEESLALVISSQEIYVAVLIDRLHYAHHVVLKNDNGTVISSLNAHVNS